MSETKVTSTPSTTQDSIREWAATHLRAIEDMLDADGLTIISPIYEGVEHQTKIALEG